MLLTLPNRSANIRAMNTPLAGVHGQGAFVPECAALCGEIVGASPAFLAALDQMRRIARSEAPVLIEGEVMDVKEFVFKPETVRGQLIFKIPQRPGSYRLVTDRFLDLVRQHRLTGFKFRLLWSLDGGAVSSKLKAWERPAITGLESLAAG